MGSESSQSVCTAGAISGNCARNSKSVLSPRLQNSRFFSLAVQFADACLGCKERLLVLDGNQKVHRAVCAAGPNSVELPAEAGAHRAVVKRLLSTCINGESLPALLR